MRRIFSSLKLVLFVALFLPLVSFAADKGDSFSLQQYGMTIDQVKKAAADGNADAEYALGYMYYYGKGLPQDEESARMWIGKAAAQGQPQAAQALQLLKQPGQAQTVAKQPTDPAAAAQTAMNPNSAPAASNNVAATAPANNAPVDIGAANPANNSSVATPAAANATTPAALQQATSANGNATSGNPASPAVNATQNAINHSGATANAVVAQDNNVTPQENPVAHKKEKEVATAGALTVQKLMDAPAHYYTVQLLGSFSKADAVDFISRNKLGHKAVYYKANYEGKPWFVVVYGLYANESSAKTALDHLAPQLDRAKPWVKSITAVRASMK